MTRKFWISAVAAALVGACSNGSGNDGGTGGNGDAGQTCAFLDASYQTNCIYDPAFTQTYPNTPNTIGVTFSGETLGVDGLPFIPNLAGDPVFVDGWSVQILESLVVVGNIRLDPGAAQSSIWQDVTANNTPISSLTPAVLKPGPYVMDAHRVGGFLGKDGIEQASALFLIPGLDNGQSFDTNTLYAFSYQTQQATWPVTNANLDPAAAPRLPAHGAAPLGQADPGSRDPHHHPRRQGRAEASPRTGRTRIPAIQAKFEAMPQQVYFAFGYDDHTQMYNCVNPDNAVDSSGSCPDPITCLAARGVQTNNNGMYIAQITASPGPHLLGHAGARGRAAALRPHRGLGAREHQPRESVLDQQPHQPAARHHLLGRHAAAGSRPLHAGQHAELRRSERHDLAAAHRLQRDLRPGPGDHEPERRTTFRRSSYPDFMEFSVQSQTHLNAQGICYIEGQHAADPFFTPNVQPVTYGDPECTLSTGCGTPSASSSSSSGSGSSSSTTSQGNSGTTGGSSTGTSGGSSSSGTTSGADAG